MKNPSTFDLVEQQPPHSHGRGRLPIGGWRLAPDSRLGDKADGIATQDQCLFLGRQFEQADLFDLHTGVKPRPVGAEQDLARTRRFTACTM